jgi:hypothetical protein
MADNTTGTSPAADTIDPWGLSSAQATALLDQKSAQFAAQSAAPVPSAEQVQDARDAEIRLAALQADPSWVKRFMSGSLAERREHEALVQIINDGVDETGTIRLGEIETVTEGNVRRQDLFGALSDLNKIGIPEAGLERFLDGDFSEQDQLWAQQSLDKALSTKAWTDALLAGDPTARHEFTAWCAVVSAGKVV